MSTLPNIKLLLIEAVKSKKNKTSRAKIICNVLYDDIAYKQDKIVCDLVEVFRENSQDYTNKPQSADERAEYNRFLKDIELRVKDRVLLLINEYYDLILDAKNENLITKLQMKELLIIVTSLKKAIEQDE